MKLLNFLICLLFLFSSQILAAEAGFSGFSQVKVDSSHFSLGKTRVRFISQDVKGSSGLSIYWDGYIDFNAQGEYCLGFANAVIKPEQTWLPEIIIGRILDPVNWQYPAPNNVPVVTGYPSALLAKAISTGIYLRENYGRLWLMSGVTNGNGDFQDDNQSLGFSSRATYTLPFGFTLGANYQQAKQPDDDSHMFGGDLAFKYSKLWLNGGQNTFEYLNKKTGRWLWGTCNLTSNFQFVGLYDWLKVSDQISDGWTVGLNIIPSPKTVVRVDYFKATVNGSKGFGIMFQQEF